jgi:tripartite-type tricarboxylate transporter receptor subunit TctC
VRSGCGETVSAVARRPDRRPNRLSVRFAFDFAPADRRKFRQGVGHHGTKRAATLPQVPTAREQGLPFDVIAWQAIFLPKQTPEAIVERLNRAISETLDTPSVRDRFAAVGEEVTAPERRGPEYLGKFVGSEIERWSGPIRASGATMD